MNARSLLALLAVAALFCARPPRPNAASQNQVAHQCARHQASDPGQRPGRRCDRRRDANLSAGQSVEHGRLAVARASNSDAIIASIGADKPLRHNTDMAYVLVPPFQRPVDVEIIEYPDESDKGPFPIPANVPIEGWPAAFTRDHADKRLTLDDVQRDSADIGGDRHAIVVDPHNGVLIEFFRATQTDRGWQATGVAMFDLKSNQLRPDGWTSADAAGLPIFPAIIRYDELRAGVIDHAMRVTVRNTRRAYVYPATHFASRKTDENLPRMGERLRLKADYDTSRFSPAVQAILNGLKKYGMFVADNGPRVGHLLRARRAHPAAARRAAQSARLGVRSRPNARGRPEDGAAVRVGNKKKTTRPVRR